MQWRCAPSKFEDDDVSPDSKRMGGFSSKPSPICEGFLHPGWQCLAQNVQLPLMIRMHNSSSQILAPPWCLCHLDLVIWGRGFFLLDLWFAFSVFFWGDNFCQQVNSGTSIERIGCVNGFWCKTSCWPAIGLKRKETFSWSIGRIPCTYPWKSTTIKKMGDSFWKMINPYKK